MSTKIFLLFLISILFLGCPDDEPCTTCPSPVDTTSHDFVWTIDTLGDASSQLNDVIIINDTCAWAVGSMYLQDSTGNFIYPIYNAAYWNGKEWSLKRISVNFRSNIITPPLEGAFSFSATDIWFVGSLPIHGDGQSWTIYDVRSIAGLESISVAKSWGKNSSSMYFVGLGGSIVYYNGTTWQKIESGTTLPIQDIWGSTDTETGEQQILAVASNKFLNEGKKLLQIYNTTATAISDSGLSWSLSSIWFEANRQYYIVGGGLYKKTSIVSDKLWQTFHQGLTAYYANTIRANNRNDIVIVGAFGNFLHYNGSTWKNYMGNELPAINGSYYSVAIKNNLVVAVGHIGSKAIVVMGKRN
ncbi:MAG: glucosyl transferase [Ignavibacteriales bacterium]|nr:glucosyl transferase [Ignavibacteriales bacterium]